ncbi:polypyrimidine tract-binding protein homolog 1-like [Olea europaea var. sylvestris]|uniref:polypyrimidine tract-binding protein homolog 1-like n=1 Tax=Olea europaea var. sylvestris TaxID=158386 RepID=UPI000C1D3101|nr:polypyrimidine tract-binding protein homolog 1-like [Olea europaea var. sylvestris]
MSTMCSQPQQFWYTQTPSKVLHVGNLPVECIEEELVKLCKPFSKIVNTKCNVDANHNQAFVEFVDINQGVNMVAYCALASEPPQVRGKTVYIQYSNRNEIVNNKSSGDVPGNVLLVTIEGVEAGNVSIDVIHLVFAIAFGFLLFFLHMDSCFVSSRRDYTNPYLPVNPTAMEGFVQPVVGPDGENKEVESNMQLASIENMQYAVNVDVLHTVLSAYGTVQKIAIFENGGTQALIQYPGKLLMNYTSVKFS